MWVGQSGNFCNEIVVSLNTSKIGPQPQIVVLLDIG